MDIPSALSVYAGVTVIDEERRWLFSLSHQLMQQWNYVALYTKALYKLE